MSVHLYHTLSATGSREYSSVYNGCEIIQGAAPDRVRGAAAGAKKVNRHVDKMLLAAGRAYGQNLSLAIDGNDDDVLLDLSAEPFFQNPTDFTAEMWFRSTDNGPIIGPFPDGMRTLTRLTGNRYNIEVGEYNGRLLVAHTNFTPPATSLTPIDVGPSVVNQWRHLRIDYSSGNVTVYIDCAQVYTGFFSDLGFGIAQFHVGEFSGALNLN